MGVAINQSGNDATTLQVDSLRLRSSQRHGLTRCAYGDKAAVAHGDRLGFGIAPVQRGDATVEEDNVRVCSRVHGDASVLSGLPTFSDRPQGSSPKTCGLRC